MEERQKMLKYKKREEKRVGIHKYNNGKKNE